jgi:hypothetical protein
MIPMELVQIIRIRRMPDDESRPQHVVRILRHNYEVGSLRKDMAQFY